MEVKIGLLSKNRELIDDFVGDLMDYEISNYTNIDNIRHENFSVIAVDADLFNDINAMQFYLSKIRKKFKGLPILLILRELYLDVIEMEWFFDDFTIFPFRGQELKTRIQRILWDRNLVDDVNIISVGNLKINLKEYSVYLNNKKLDFTYKEFELMRFLVQNRDVVYSRKELLNKIWGVDYIGGTRTVDVHVRRLRSKLGDEFNSIIETVRNVGYRCRSLEK